MLMEGLLKLVLGKECYFNTEFIIDNEIMDNELLTIKSWEII